MLNKHGSNYIYQQTKRKMKKLATIFLAAAALLASCSKEQVEPKSEAPGKLILSATAVADVILKAGISTDNFTVTISKNGDASFTPIVKKVSELTSAVELAAGTYTVSVKSADFTAPAFDTPVYGAEDNNVVITSGQTTTTTLTCAQTNAGVKLSYTADFETYCQSKGYEYSASVCVKSTPTTLLDYGKKNATENTLNAGVGYFAAGDVTVKVTMNGNEYTKDITLAAKQRWTINVGVNKLTSPQLKVTVTGEDGVTTETETFTFTEQ